MNTYDPRILIRALNLLTDEVQRFTQTSSDTVQQAEYTQNYARERVTQAIHWSAITQDFVESTSEAIYEVETEVNSLLSQCSAGIEIAHETIDIVNQSLRDASLTLNHWQKELTAALAWQAQAEARLELAVQAYRRAENDLMAAKSQLSRAEGDLQRCRNDSERRNCNSESHAYDTARRAVSMAEDEVHRAEVEVRAAQNELEQAKARVRCCQKAVDCASQAVQHAQSAKGKATQALNDAELSLENTESANRAVNNAQDKLQNATEELEPLIVNVNQAEGFTDQSQTYILSARHRADSAHRLAKIGTQELDYRITHLIEFNQPSSGI